MRCGGSALNPIDCVCRRRRYLDIPFCSLLPYSATFLQVVIHMTGQIYCCAVALAPDVRRSLIECAFSDILILICVRRNKPLVKPPREHPVITRHGAPSRRMRETDRKEHNSYMWAGHCGRTTNYGLHARWKATKGSAMNSSYLNVEADVRECKA